MRRACNEQYELFNVVGNAACLCFSMTILKLSLLRHFLLLTNQRFFLGNEGCNSAWYERCRNSQHHLTELCTFSVIGICDWRVMRDAEIVPRATDS